MREERKKIWIDSFQTRLFYRLGVYWLIYLVAQWNLLFFWRLLQEGPGNPLEQYGRFFWENYPSLICFIVLFPILAWDAVTFSHRLLGPLFRFRKTVQALAAGEAVRPIKLRNDDFLQEMKDDFNGMLENLQRQGASVLKPSEPALQGQQPRSA